MEQVSCPNCGQQITEAGLRFCPACGGSLGADTGAPGGAPPPGGGDTPGRHLPPPENTVPFEDTSLPFIQRITQTIGMAISDPMRLFSGLTQGDIGAPLLYGVLIGTVTALFSILWNVMFGGTAMLLGGAEADEFAVSTGIYLLFAFLSPLLALVGLFVSSAIYHVALLILGDGQRGFSVTFRAVAYGNTPNLLAVIPFCGGLVGGIWALVLIIIGGRLGHGTDWWRAILAYFLPLIVCCCLAWVLAMMFGFVGALSS